MPIYVYCCDGCGERFEKLVSLSSADKKQTCPKCDSGNTRKVPAAANFGGSGVKQSTDSSCAGCSSGNCSSCH